MGLSQRERIIVLVTLLVVGALVGDRLVLAPITNGLGELRAERQKSLAQVAKAKNLLQEKQQRERKKACLRRFPQRRGGGKPRRQGAGQVVRRRPAGTFVRQARPGGRGDKGLKEILFVIAGKGSLDAVAWFLYQVETSELPIKVKHLQLGSTSESGDNMSLELRLSTLYRGGRRKVSAEATATETTREDQ